MILLPGVVAGYLPLQLAQFTNHLHPSLVSIASIAGMLLIAAGAMVLGWCVWDFFAAGKGTLAPIDPPRRLVVRGPYRFTRNPMYNAVLVVLLGESLLFRSLVLLGYAVAVTLLFHLFVILYEEPALSRRFGDEYRSYRRAVPRWGFVRPRADGGVDRQSSGAGT